MSQPASAAKTFFRLPPQNAAKRKLHYANEKSFACGYT
jgi:hypothetical protein